MVQNLENMGFNVVAMGQGFASMSLDRAIRCGNDTSESVYDKRGELVF